MTKTSDIKRTNGMIHYNQPVLMRRRYIQEKQNTKQVFSSWASCSINSIIFVFGVKNPPNKRKQILLLLDTSMHTPRRWEIKSININIKNIHVNVLHLTPTPQRRPLQNRADPDQAALVARSGSTPFVHGKHNRAMNLISILFVPCISAKIYLNNFTVGGAPAWIPMKERDIGADASTQPI